MTKAPLLPFETLGNEKSDNLIVLLHGYPDTSDIWKDVINKIDKDAYIINISYPNFSEKVKSVFGMSQFEAQRRVGLIIESFQSQKKRQITMVAHDWGAFIGYLFDQNNPGVLKQLITLDIAGWMDRRPQVLKYFLAYQIPLLLAFIIGIFLPFIGNYISKNIITNKFQYNPPYFKRINSGWNYFYFYYYVNLICSIFKPSGKWLAKYIPKTPIVYIYGEKKPFQFHSLKWIQFLESIKGCEVHSQDSGHWIQTEKPDFVAALIKRRLAS